VGDFELAQVRGSSQSRQASPRRLKESTAIMTALRKDKKKIPRSARDGDIALLLRVGRGEERFFASLRMTDALNGRGDAEAEEAEGGFNENLSGDADGGLYEDPLENVGSRWRTMMRKREAEVGQINSS
jgi:hypothetical protein